MNQRVCIALNKLFWKTPMPPRFSSPDEWAEYWVGELSDGPDDYRIEGVQWSRELQEFIPTDT